MAFAKIKICGITNLKDALFCAKKGADYLGFVFAKSPRRITPSAASKVIKNLRGRVKKIGVFVNQGKGFVERTAHLCGLDALQFHGDETPAYCAYFAGKGFKIIKAIRVRDSDSIKAIEKYKTVDFILLDCFNKDSYGGTGMTFDWKIAKEAEKFEKRIFLSGGLNSRNVKKAILSVKPFAVDASSRLEISPGKKDHTLVERFIRLAKSDIKKLDK